MVNWVTRTKGFGSLFADIIAPTRCAICRAVGVAVCRDCFSALAALPRPSLQRTAYGFYQPAFWYQTPVQTIIQRAKFRSDQKGLEALAILASSRWLARLSSPQLLIPIPLGSKRAQYRGYNQADLIAQVLVANFLLYVPLSRSLLRIRETKPQTFLSKDERVQNLADSFHWSGPSIQGMSVWLIDDVSTTGATLDNAAKAMTVAGATLISSVTIAGGRDFRGANPI